jgi:hypothetical protein
VAKKSKLLEKSTRMPDIQETSLDQVVSEYLAAAQSLSSEPARSQRFTLLLDRLFRLQPGFIEDYVAGVEKYLTGADVQPAGGGVAGRRWAGQDAEYWPAARDGAGDVEGRVGGDRRAHHPYPEHRDASRNDETSGRHYMRLEASTSVLQYEPRFALEEDPTNERIPILRMANP